MAKLFSWGAKPSVSKATLLSNLNELNRLSKSGLRFEQEIELDLLNECIVFATNTLDRQQTGQQRLIALEKDLKEVDLIMQNITPQIVNFGPFEISTLKGVSLGSSGDFWFTKESHHGYFIAVGDCTGHGFKASLGATLAKGVLNAINWDDQFEFVDCVRLLNRSLFLTFKGYLNLTLIAIWIPKKNPEQIAMINAAHEPPLIYRAQSGQLEYVLAHEILPRLGEHQEINASMQPLQLQTLDHLILLSDGLWTLQGSKKRPLNDRQFLKLVQEVVAEVSHPAECTGLLKQMLIEYVDQKGNEDDLSLIWLRLKG